MAQTVVGDRQKLKVFISYSRKDSDFAGDLLTGLQACGFEPYLDKRDIAPGEPWEERLARLIQSADTVAFVISPASVASERCGWEVERAIKLGKRLMPVIWESVPETAVPVALRRLNYTLFSGPDRSYAKGLADLARALETDLEWIREHTRLGDLATRWDGRGRPEAQLLRGEEILAAKDWIARQPKEAPAPTLLHRELIAGSEKAEQDRIARERAQEAAAKDAEVGRIRAEQEADRARLEAEQLKAQSRRRRTQALVTGLLVVGLVGAGFLWREIGRAQRDAAEQAKLAETEKKLAEVERKNAEFEKRLREAVAVTQANPQKPPSEAPPPPAPDAAARAAQVTAEEVARRASPAAIEMMVAFEVGGKASYEQKFTHPFWAGVASGVVIGIGYDLGYTSADSFRADWSGRIAQADFDRLLAVMKVRGEPVKALLPGLEDITIPWEAAIDVFQARTLTTFATVLERNLPNVRELPPDCYGALLSLAFNRGGNFTSSGDGRKEMRAIRELMEKRDFAGIPEQMRAMKRLWPTLPALQARRDAEAALFERGLAAKA